MREPTKEEIELIRNEIFAKPTKEAVIDEMRKLAKGKNMMPLCNRFYFFEERTKAIGENGRPFHLVTESDEHFLKVYRKATEYLERTCYDANRHIHSIAKMMSDYGRLYRVYHIPSLFNYKRAREIIAKYNTNGRVYDYACGWGQRLLATLVNHCHYYGTDTNPELCRLLDECANDYAQATGNVQMHDIRCQQSETFIPEFENTMRLCFSSPPYFDCEIYQGAKTSTTPYPDYESWRENYLRATIRNCKRYLIQGGFFICNIKNLKQPNRPMYEDAMRICEEEGLQFVCEEDYKVARRTGASNVKQKTQGYCDEKMMVFQNTPPSFTPPDSPTKDPAGRSNAEGAENGKMRNAECGNAQNEIRDMQEKRKEG